ncbi:MAG TPA: M36 family metallopeptidase [Gaiellaceae bacterium]|nr:M36 family metallopeptidase [Gaiellaceae bacterium]
MAVLAGAAAAIPPERRAERAFLDVRTERPVPAVAPGPAHESLRLSLGPLGVLDLDPRTGTPRVVARLDGFLTGPSDRDAADVVLDYVRARPGVFGLADDDVAALRLVRDETDSFGVRRLLWAQTAGGIPSFDTDLRASVARDGRLLNVMGSPLPGLSRPGEAPALAAGDAVVAALEDAGRRPASPPRPLASPRGAAQETAFAGDHRAGLVLVYDGRGTRLAWHVTAHADGDEVYDVLVDAETGEVVRRAPKVERAEARVFDHYPDAPLGGTTSLRELPAAWLAPGATKLNGPYARVWADLNDNDKVDAGEEAASAGGVWDNEPARFTHANGFCAPGFASTCTWDSWTGGSWAANVAQSQAQVFWFVNTFHDHLKDDPDIAWTERNFEDADKVLAHTHDGAALGGGFLGPNMPDSGHVSNANMYTPPDGVPPRMQMYLFASWTGAYATDPTPDTNGGDDASVVYHEYAHGLSNRLITYVSGWGALDRHQSRAMGEGWSDWYALDFLADDGFAEDDLLVDGEVLVGRHVDNGERRIRTQGLDCPVASAAPGCPGGHDTAGGGYTYGDLGSIAAGGPQVHADGEIWAETLWELRAEVGVSDARYLVTQGMRESPPNPSFLDLRNAMLQANTVGVANGRADRSAEMWDVFARRGMGWFAATEDAGDTAPVESFALPPDPADGAGTVSGTVRERLSGAPVPGAKVTIAGPEGLTATTNAKGRYSIDGVPPGTYPKVVVARPGYERVVATDLAVAADEERVADFLVRRNWAALAGGAKVTSFSGPDYGAQGCGPKQAFDGSLATGWASSLPPGKTRQVTVRLPAFVDVTSFAVDPGAICGDPDPASLKGYELAVSKTGKSGSWKTVKTGSFTLASAHRLNRITISKRRAVRFVRLTMLSNHGHASWVDLAELEVHGKRTPMCFGRPATIVGTEGRDRLRGGDGPDVIVGLGGDDTIDAGGGNDRICAGAGDDVIKGGGGRDLIDAGPGDDGVLTRDGVRETRLKGGKGTDRILRDDYDRARGFEARL